MQSETCATLYLNSGPREFMNIEDEDDNDTQRVIMVSVVYREVTTSASKIAEHHRGQADLVYPFAVS